MTGSESRTTDLMEMDTQMPAAADKPARRTRRSLRLVIALSTASLAAVLLAPSALGAFGDNFGMAPINDSPGATDSSVAFTDATGNDNHAFWAGACDRLNAPAPPAGAGDPPVPIAGGIGGIPPQILVPAFNIPPFGLVGRAPTLTASPTVPEHCIDPGAPSNYKTDLTVWRASPTSNGVLGPQSSACGGSFAPCWRLAPVVKAGARPDGSTSMAFARGSNAQTDGSPDNIIVDLPAGFVGNPTAVPECTGEQFAARPLACPPEAQVGVIRLQVEGAGAGVEGGNWITSEDLTVPVFNVEPREGNVAELGFGHIGDGGLVTVRLVAKPRTNGDYGVTAFVGQIPAALAVISQTITLWGVPWAAHNDMWRPKAGHFTDTPCRTQPVPAPLTNAGQNIPPSGLVPACRASYDPSWGSTPAERVIRPFLTNETDCNPSPSVSLATDSYQHPGAFNSEGDPILLDPPTADNWETYTSVSPAVTDCLSLDFAPDIGFEPTNPLADGASGLRVDLSVPQKNDPRSVGGGSLDPPVPGASSVEVAGYVQAATDYWRSDAGRAVSHLRDTVVTLPAGVSVNPSAAVNLRSCSDGGIGVRGSGGGRVLFNNGDPFDADGASDGADCPDESIIGTVDVETPLLDEELTGEVVLGEPKKVGNPPRFDSESGEMLRLFLVIRNRERGLVAKIYGSTAARGSDGQLTATFRQNPELPFDGLQLEFRGGDRGVLAMAQRCGAHGWSAVFSPWSGGPNVSDRGDFELGGDCGFGFAPQLAARTVASQGRAHSPFTFRFSRRDGEQWVSGLTAELPAGLLAKVRGVGPCRDGEAAAGSCPAGSRIGSVDATAGSGSPFVLERKGDVYLTEGYKGGAYGLMVKVPVQAGPFRDGLELDPIVVRQAIHVDPTTARVTAVSDPLPLIHEGIPLRVREVVVDIDRPQFMLNPSDCSAKEIAAAFASAQGAVSRAGAAFHASSCASLPFKPKLALALTGKKQTTTGKHPGIKAKVTQTGIGEAGIEKAVVRLPKSLALDPDNAQALCEFEDGTKDDIEKHCPKGSIVGRARATTPLLNDPLVGNVYFVKNIRTDAKTGNQIRTLPMIMVALRGEIAINLKGESNTTKDGKLVNTFDNVPDAPVSQFNLNIKGGKNGILAVTRTRRARINLCAGRHVAEADMDGHNGRRHDRAIRMKTPCTKRRTRAAKPKAKQRADGRAKAKRPAARRRSP